MRIKLPDEKLLPLSELEMKLKRVENPNNPVLINTIGICPYMLFNEQHGEPVYSWQPFSNVKSLYSELTPKQIVEECSTKGIHYYQYFDNPREAVRWLFQTYAEHKDTPAKYTELQNINELNTYPYTLFAPKTDDDTIRLVKRDKINNTFIWHGLGFNSWFYNTAIVDVRDMCESGEVFGMTTFEDLIKYIYFNLYKEAPIYQIQDVLRRTKYLFSPNSSLIYKIGKTTADTVTLCDIYTGTPSFCFQFSRFTMEGNDLCVDGHRFKPIKTLEFMGGEKL